MSDYTILRLEELTKQSGNESPLLRWHKRQAAIAKQRLVRGPQRVYVVPGRHCVKVGITWDMDERWARLRSANPHIEQPHFVSEPLKKAKGIEKAAHAALKQYSINGEWFDCSRYLAAEIVRGLIAEHERSD